MLAIACAADEKYRIYVYFDNVEGLSKGIKVYSNGSEIGEVENMALDKKGVVVKLAIANNHYISSNSEFKLIELIPFKIGKVELVPNNGKDKLKDGDTLQTVFQGPLTLQKIDSLRIGMERELIEQRLNGSGITKKQ